MMFFVLEVLIGLPGLAGVVSVSQSRASPL